MTLRRDVPYAPDPRPGHQPRTQSGARDISRADARRLLLALVGAPLAWVLHLSACYVILSLWCAEAWGGMTIALVVATVLCAAMAIASGVLAWRLWQRGQHGLLTDEEPGGPEPWDARMGERGARTVFLAVLALFMAGMFTFLIGTESLSPMFAPACPVGEVAP